MYQQPQHQPQVQAHLPQQQGLYPQPQSDNYQPTIIITNGTGIDSTPTSSLLQNNSITISTSNDVQTSTPTKYQFCLDPRIIASFLSISFSLLLMLGGKFLFFLHDAHISTSVEFWPWAFLFIVPNICQILYGIKVALTYPKRSKLVPISTLELRSVGNRSTLEPSDSTGCCGGALRVVIHVIALIVWAIWLMMLFSMGMVNVLSFNGSSDVYKCIKIVFSLSLVTSFIGLCVSIWNVVVEAAALQSRVTKGFDKFTDQLSNSLQSVTHSVQQPSQQQQQQQPHPYFQTQGQQYYQQQPPPQQQQQYYYQQQPPQQYYQYEQQQQQQQIQQQYYQQQNPSYDSFQQNPYKQDLPPQYPQ